jgi:hypothetical protein
MTFKLQAPYPTLQTTSHLPNPQLGESVGNVTKKNDFLAMDGTKYTYVKTTGRVKMVWTFRLTQGKKEEVAAFYRSYKADELRIIDHLGDIYIGFFTSNPLEFESLGRAVDSPTNNVDHNCQIEFEGTKQ